MFRFGVLLLLLVPLVAIVAGCPCDDCNAATCIQCCPVYAPNDLVEIRGGSRLFVHSVVKNGAAVVAYKMKLQENTAPIATVAPSAIVKKVE